MKYRNWKVSTCSVLYVLWSAKTTTNDLPCEMKGKEAVLKWGIKEHIVQVPTTIFSRVSLHWLSVFSVMIFLLPRNISTFTNFFFRKMIYVGLKPAAPNRLADESHSHYPGRPPRHPQKKGWGGCTFRAEDLDRLHGHESEDVDKRLVTRDGNESTSYVINTNQFSKTQLE